MGLGETIGPGLGAALAAVHLLAPIYTSAALAVVSAGAIWRFLPEEGKPLERIGERPPRLRVSDRRVLPFLLISIALQAVRATTVIVLAFFLQDTLHLSAQETVRYSGLGFVTLAVAGLFSQLVIVQRFRPSPRWLVRSGTVLMFAAFVLFVVGDGFPVYLAGLTSLGLGLGFVRPGAAAAASLCVSPAEQGSVAGQLSGVAVIGNVVGPMLATALYEFAHTAPYMLNAAIMVVVIGVAFGSRQLRTLRV
jgi:MFS family permease